MTKSPELDTLIRLEGRPYIELRDRILASSQLLQPILNQPEAGEAWQVRIHREILRGWLEHRDLFLRVQADLNNINVETERKKITGVSGVWTRFSALASRVYKEPVLPLCWEAILKLRGFVPEWQLLTYLHMVSVLPHPLSVEPVAGFIERSQEAGSADLAGRVLEALPREAVLDAVDARLAQPAPAGQPFRAILDRTKARLLK